MADEKDDAPPFRSGSATAPSSAVADIFNSVANWSLETFGESVPRRVETDNPFAPKSPQPLTGWSLSGAELLEHAGERPVEPVAAAPAAPSFSELYSAHERSYDSAGKDNPFVDPCSFALAVRGAPLLEASRSNTSSISAAAYAKVNLSGDKSGVTVTPPGTPGNLGTGDSIASGGASLYQAADREPADKKLTAAWQKLWRY